MIDLDSLMNGNYIKHSDAEIWQQEFRNKPILFNYDSLEDILLEPHLYDGIPLTEEILLNSGFNKVEGKINIFRTEDGVYQISFGGQYNSLFYRLYNQNEYAFINGNLYFVHQLQNLYYALTNTSLQIKI